MTDLPRIAGTFADFKLIRTRDVVQVVIEIPREKADAALTGLGGLPKPGAEVWVALMPIWTEAAIAEPVAPAPAPTAEAPRKALSIASKVAVACQDPEFQEFLSRDRDGLAMEWSRLAVPGNAAATAERVVKWWCEVERKRDIEADHRSLGRWRELSREFQHWLGSRALAQRTGAAA